MPRPSSIKNRASLGIKPAAEDPERMPSSQTQELDSSTNNILNRVTSSVSGLFSNMSWSEWLKSRGSLNAREGQFQHQRSGSNSSDLRSEPACSKQTGFRGSNQSFTQLYPEEGPTDFNTSNTQAQIPIYSGTSSEKMLIPTQPNAGSSLSSFRRGVSIISSTPALSSSGVAMRNSEAFMCESIISKPSTSFQNEVLPSREDSVDLGNFASPHADFIHYNNSGPVSRFPSSRKRIRETVEETAADDCDVRSVKRGKTLLSPPLTFTEKDKTPTEIHKLKRPRFSISSYGSPLYSKPSVEEEEPSFSIFYPGKVMYGGAANHQKKKHRIVARKVLPRTRASTTSADDTSFDGGLSMAAKRILNCIDKISTPLSNSKRILPFASPKHMSWDSSPFVADFHKHRPPVRTKEGTNAPPVTKLLTPSKVSVNKNFSSFLQSANDTQTTKQLSKITSSSSPNVIQLNPDNAKYSFPKTPVPCDQLVSKRPPIHSMKPFEIKEKRTDSIRENIRENNSKIEMSQIKQKDTRHSETVIVTPNERQNSVCDNSPQKHPQYEFSSPEVVSDDCEKEIVSYNDIEFVFSSPLHETEISSSNTEKKDVSSGNLFEKFMPKKGSWDCDTCLIQNESTAQKCVACLTPKPSSSSFLPTKPTICTPSVPAGNWGDAFKASKGSWSCETCLIQNTESATSCVACAAAKPNQEVNHASPTLNNWGDAFKPKEGSWECETCLVLNNASASKCAACQTPSPSVSSKPAPLSDAVSHSGFVGSWGNAFMPPKDSWECQQCCIMNDDKSQNCVACLAFKPKAASQTDTTQEKKTSASCSGFFRDESLSGLPQNGKIGQDCSKDVDEWMCVDCIEINKGSDDKCVACKRLRPTIANDSYLSGRTSSVTTPFSSEFFNAKDEWECETCLVRNKSTSQKCACCETPKPQADRSNLLSEAITGNFKFGVNTKPSQETTAITSASTQGKDITATTNSFCFGVQNTSVVMPKFEFSNPSPISANSVSQSTFTFGGATTSTPSFTLPSENKTIANKDESLVTPPAEAIDPKPTTFQFSSSVPAVTQKVDTTKLEFPKLAAGSTTSSKSPSGGPSNSELPVNPMTFSFFGKDNSKPAAPTAFTLPNSTETNNTAASTTQISSRPTFAFGQPNTKPLSTGFNFGEASSKSAGSFNFSFGNSEPVYKFGQSQPATSVPTKAPEAGPPSFLNIETPKANPFNTTSAGGPQRRIIKRAFRRNK